MYAVSVFCNISWPIIHIIFPILIFSREIQIRKCCRRTALYAVSAVCGIIDMQQIVVRVVRSIAASSVKLHFTVLLVSTANHGHLVGYHFQFFGHHHAALRVSDTDTVGVSHRVVIGYIVHSLGKVDEQAVFVLARFRGYHIGVRQWILILQRPRHCGIIANHIVERSCQHRFAGVMAHLEDTFVTTEQINRNLGT